MNEITSKHIESMNKTFVTEIKESAQYATVYNAKSIKPRLHLHKQLSQQTLFPADMLTILSFLYQYQDRDKRVAIVNATSPCAPSQDYIDGKDSFETSLCKISTLYNVLQQALDAHAIDNNYYQKNKSKNGLYTNIALYTPNIIFPYYAENISADVINCTAPDYNMFLDSGHFSENKNYQEIKSRLKFIRKIAEDHHVDTLILGAYGCSLFGQDATVVSKLCAEVFRHSTIPTIIYAIPNAGYDFAAYSKHFISPEDPTEFDTSELE